MHVDQITLVFSSWPVHFYLGIVSRSFTPNTHTHTRINSFINSGTNKFQTNPHNKNIDTPVEYLGEYANR